MDRRILYFFTYLSGRRTCTTADGLTMDRRILFFLTESVWPSSAVLCRNLLFVSPPVFFHHVVSVRRPSEFTLRTVLHSPCIQWKLLQQSNKNFTNAAVQSNIQRKELYLDSTNTERPRRERERECTSTTYSTPASIILYLTNYCLVVARSSEIERQEQE